MKRHIWIIITIVSISLLLQVAFFLWLLLSKKYNFQQIRNIFSIIAISFLSLKLFFYLVFKIGKHYLNKNVSNINLTDHEVAKNYLSFYDDENKDYLKYLKELKKLWCWTIAITILNLVFASAIGIIFNFIY